MTGTYWLAPTSVRGDAEATAERTEAALAPGVALRSPGGALGLLGAVGEHHDVLEGVHVAASSRLTGRGALARRLHVDPAGSDARLVAAAWHEWGDDLAGHLDGDFACTILDERRGVVVALRDLGGARPLFHWSSGDQLLGIASAPAAALASPTFPRRLDLGAAVAHLLVVPADHDATLVRDLQRLRPGHLLRWRPGQRPTIDRFARWTPTNERHRSPDAWAEALEEAIVRSVRDRIPEAGGVGAHVSGGLDSSAVAALAASEVDGSRMRTVSFSAAPDATIDGSAPVDAEPLQALGLPIEHHVPDPRTQGAPAPGMLAPAYGMTAVHRWAAGAGVSTFLTGWGGDEGASFNGRDAIATLLRQGRLPEVVRAWRGVRPHVRARRPYLRDRVVEPLLPDRLWWELQRMRRAPVVHRIDRSIVAAEAAHRFGIDDALRHPVRPRAGQGRTQVALLESPHLVDRTDGWAVDAARFGLTCAHPLLDRRVIGIALAAPPELSLWDGWDRWLFRRAIQAHVPAAVAWQRGKADSHVQRATARRQGSRSEDLLLARRRIEELVDAGDDLGGIIDLPILDRSLALLRGTAWADLPPMERRRLLGLAQLGSLVAFVDANGLEPSPTSVASPR